LGKLLLENSQDPFSNAVRFLFEMVIGTANLESLLFISAAHNRSHGLVLSPALRAGLSHRSTPAALFANDG
jgi:hypothetical protein